MDNGTVQITYFHSREKGNAVKELPCELVGQWAIHVCDPAQYGRQFGVTHTHSGLLAGVFYFHDNAVKYANALDNHLDEFTLSDELLKKARRGSLGVNDMPSGFSGTVKHLLDSFWKNDTRQHENGGTVDNGN